MNDLDVEKRAQLLCQDLVDGIAKSNLCSLTTAIYDTAWLSMVSKADGESPRWLFPESFQYLLSQQLPSGGWEAYATKEDGVLNSLAALLALKRHQRSADYDVMLQSAIQSAVTFLEESLQTLDIDGSLPVGFEILVPALLAMLEDEGISLSSPATESLLAISEIKMDHFTPELLYGTAETTLLHSLEALINKIDFDRIRHRCISGSMLASPASTAAYLMNISSWDDEAESYLQRVIREGSGKSNGAAPSVFPTPIFEVSWVVSTLSQGGFSGACLGQESLNAIASYLEQHYHAQNGLLGFAPLMQADADDSAKATLTLNLLGRGVDANPLAEHFRSKNGHFSTYPGERDVSFSANCNVLRALLEAPDIYDHQTDIQRVLEFLCESWWSGAIKDKWNCAPEYSMMLLSEALIRLLEVWDQGYIDKIPDTLLRDQLPIVLVQILNRTLASQSFARLGESEQSLEVTAYAVLTLKNIVSLPWLGLLQQDIVFKIEESQNILRDHRTSWKKHQYLWVEKVTYGSPFLSEAYYLAAIHKKKQLYPWTEKTRNLVQISEQEKNKVTRLFCKLQCFESQSLEKIHACVLEGLLFLPQLRSSLTNVLSGEQSAKNEYMSFIPCTWVVVNIVRELFLDTYLLWDMMVLTLSNFRVDEYMETMMAELDDANLHEARISIQEFCSKATEEKYDLSNQASTNAVNHSYTSYSAHSDPPLPQETPAPHSASQVDLVKIYGVLSSYIHTILSHPRIARAPKQDLATLSTALHTFLNSHIDQCSVNRLFLSRRPTPSSSTPHFWSSHSFLGWLHGIAAPSVSAPFSFTFLACLTGGLPTSITRYLAADFGTRVALMSRMYNDLGSVVRDEAEGNLNCVDFPELNDGQSPGMAKRRLVELAKYERDAAGWVGARLRNELRSAEGRRKGRMTDAVRLFLGVAELYADVYEVKDLSNRLDGGT